MTKPSRSHARERGGSPRPPRRSPGIRGEAVPEERRLAPVILTFRKPGASVTIEPARWETFRGKRYKIGPTRVGPHSDAPCVWVRLMSGEMETFRLRPAGLESEDLEIACRLWAEIAWRGSPRSGVFPIPHPLAVFTRLVGEHDPITGPRSPVTVHDQNGIPLLHDEMTGRVLVPLWFDIGSPLDRQLQKASHHLKAMRRSFRSTFGEVGIRSRGGRHRDVAAVEVRRLILRMLSIGPTDIAEQESRWRGEAQHDVYAAGMVSASIRKTWDRLGDLRLLQVFASDKPYPLS